MDRISYDDFAKIDIRVGRIVQVDAFPQARKPAYRLRIDFGPTIGVLRLSGSVDDTAHHRHPQFFRAGIAGLPRGPLLAQVCLNLLRHLLEECRRRAAAAGTSGHLGRKAPQSERLQDLLRDLHLFGAVSSGTRGERDANRVADALLEKTGESRRAGDDSLRLHSRFRETEMPWLVGRVG